MTKSELAVAQPVANGLTNREVAERPFVSPHTVDAHLRQVFAKLEVNSRVDPRGLRQSATASTPPEDARASHAAQILTNTKSHGRAM